jgi:hypothetical protein
MSFPVLPDHITISTSDAEALHAVIDLIVRRNVDQVVTVTTRRHPDALTLTILARLPGQQAGHIYGASYIQGGDPEPDVGLPVIAYDDIRAIHLW